MRVREMAEADAAAVAAVRVRGWRHAYRGLVPQPYLEAMSVEEDAARHRRRLADSGGSALDLVAEDGGRVVGWAAAGPYRGDGVPPDAGELYALYVLPERIGTGVGRALLAEALRWTAACGRSRVLLWVLEGNAHARRFYEAAGFAADGAEGVFEVGGAPVREVRYAGSPQPVRR